VIRKKHQIPRRERAADAASGIREDDRFASDRGEEACAEHSAIEGVSFVKMNAALEARDADAFHLTEDEIASMPDDSGLGHVGDL
jgi:hypothetical protein